MSFPEKHKPLASTWFFWTALIVPIFIGATLSVLISLSTNASELCFEPECIQRFFYIFKFPIAIAGLSLPLIAMVAAIHRSNEASLQIKISSAQYEEALKNNRFGNYLKHRESFEKLIDSYCSTTYHGNRCKIMVKKLGLYSSLFPGSGLTKIDWNGEHSQKRLEFAESSAKAIVFLAKSPKEEFDLEILITSIYTMQGIFQINYSPFKAVEFEEIESKFARPIVLPGYSPVYSGIALAASDCLSILALIRSYIGTNNSEDLSITAHIANLAKNLEDVPSKVVTEGKF